MEKYFPTTIAFTIFSDEHYHRVEVYEVESGFWNANSFPFQFKDF